MPVLSCVSVCPFALQVPSLCTFTCDRTRVRVTVRCDDACCGVLSARCCGYGWHGMVKPSVLFLGRTADSYLNTLDALGLVSILSSIIVGALYVVTRPRFVTRLSGSLSCVLHLGVFFACCCCCLPLSLTRYQSKTITVGTSNLVAIVFILSLLGMCLLFLWCVSTPVSCSTASLLLPLSPWVLCA